MIVDKRLELARVDFVHLELNLNDDNIVPNSR